MENDCTVNGRKPGVLFGLNKNYEIFIVSAATEFP
jgi:hypothetical protein